MPRGSEIEPTIPRQREEARKVARETGAEKEIGTETGRKKDGNSTKMNTDWRLLEMNQNGQKSKPFLPHESKEEKSFP